MVRSEDLIVRNLKVFDYIFFKPEDESEVVKTYWKQLSMKQVIDIARKESLIYSRMEERVERRVMSKEFFFKNSSVSKVASRYKR